MQLGPLEMANEIEEEKPEEDGSMRSSEVLDQVFANETASCRMYSTERILAPVIVEPLGARTNKSLETGSSHSCTAFSITAHSSLGYISLCTCCVLYYRDIEACIYLQILRPALGNQDCQKKRTSCDRPST
jgi:hypothetical protein